MAVPSELNLGKVDTVEVAFDELCGALAARDMKGLWSRPPLDAEPISRTQPYLWRWETVAPLAKRAGQVLNDLDGGVGQRRALQFCNPGLRAGTTEALFGAYQYLEAHETAPAHRHTPAAIRFMVSGSSAFTTVDGDACEMEPGDLILTPKWSWHDHTNESDEPAIWLDVIDVVLVATLESVFFEDHPVGMQEVVERTPDSPLLRYPYADIDRALDELHDRVGGPSVTVDYEDPVTGGPAVPTITCQMTRVYAGQRTRPQRQTGGRIHLVFRGSGRSVIAGKEFNWGPGDVFVVPSWVPVEHEAAETADIFVGGSQATLEALGLYREEQLSEHQDVTGSFVPLSGAAGAA